MKGFTAAVAAKLRDPQAVARSQVFPYQLMAAYRRRRRERCRPRCARPCRTRWELALANVPRFVGQVVVCPDVSGSMPSPVTGYRGSATSVARCIDVAALVAAAVLDRNRQATGDAVREQGGAAVA